MSVDPLADQFPSWTPYHYVHNNPIRLLDPSGMSTDTVPSTLSLTVTDSYSQGKTQVNRENGTNPAYNYYNNSGLNVSGDATTLVSGIVKFFIGGDNTLANR